MNQTNHEVSGGAELEVPIRSLSSSPSRAGNGTPVSAIMTTDVVCVTADLPVGTLDRLLSERGISGAPVVDDAGRPIGVISDSDLLRLHRKRGDGASPLSDGDLRVRDVMMPMAFCLPQNESIEKVAALMAFEGIHRVPIVDAAGKVTGIVSSLDVLTWVARQNGYVLATRR